MGGNATGRAVTQAPTLTRPTGPMWAPARAGAPSARRVLLLALRLRRRDSCWLAAWSAVEALPAFVFGRAVAGVIDAFGKGRPGIAAGLCWLAALLGAAAAGAFASRRAYARLAAVVEPLRDMLIRWIVWGELRRSVQLARPAETGAVARITHQTEIVRDSFAGLVTVARTSAFTAGGALIGLFTLAPAIAVLVIVPLMAALGLFAWLIRAFARRQREYVKKEERVAASASDVIAALRDVTACGAEERVCAELGGHVGAQARAGRAVAGIGAVRTLVLAVGVWLPLFAVLATAPWLMRHGVTAGGVVGAVAYIGGGLQIAVTTLVQGAGSSGVRFTVTLERLLSQSWASAAEPVDGEGAASGGPALAAVNGQQAVNGTGLNGTRRSGARLSDTTRGLTGSIPTVQPRTLRLSRVTFAYGISAEPVLRDLDLDVPYGDHLAIVGPSGIGKSTLAGLMAGLLRPLRGQVLLGGVDVSALGPTALARHRVLLPQEAYVFAGTLRENLTYLNPAAGTAAIDRAADAVGLSPLAARLGGYEARLLSDSLSAGERQLIALARAYLSQAPITVLDEATCHLDPASEARAENAFAERPGTLVVIAHRASSARRARRILVFDGARAQAGDHESLLSRSPLYADLIGHWDAGLPG